MKKYEPPVCELIEFAADVITTSLRYPDETLGKDMDGYDIPQG